MITKNKNIKRVFIVFKGKKICTEKYWLYTSCFSFKYFLLHLNYNTKKNIYKYFKKWMDNLYILLPSFLFIYHLVKINSIQQSKNILISIITIIIIIWPRSRKYHQLQNYYNNIICYNVTNYHTRHPLFMYSIHI